MSLGKSKIFRVVACTLFGLAIIPFAVRVVHMLATGHGAETYANVKGFPVAYWSALVVMVLATGIGLLAIGIKIWQKKKPD